MCDVETICIGTPYGRNLYVVKPHANGILIEVRHSNVAVALAIREHKGDLAVFSQWQNTDKISARKWLAQIVHDFKQEFETGRVQFCFCDKQAANAVAVAEQPDQTPKPGSSVTLPDTIEADEFTLSELEKALAGEGGDADLLNRFWPKRVPLFKHDALTVDTLTSAGRTLLCRSARMEDFLGSAAVKLRDGKNGAVPKYLSIIYLLLSDSPEPCFYVGICRRWGSKGAISANIKSVNPRSKGGWSGVSHFARWGDGPDWHIGQLSDSLFGGAGKHVNWVANLFSNPPTPVLKCDVRFSCFLIKNDGDLTGNLVANEQINTRIRDVETKLVKRLQGMGLYTLNKQGAEDEENGGDMAVESNSKHCSNAKGEGALSIDDLKRKLAGKRILYVIPCCADKCYRGSLCRAPAGHLPALLPLGLQSHFFASRLLAQGLLRKPPVVNPMGSEFGVALPMNADYLPAFDRYCGHLYRVPGVRGLLKSPPSHVIFAVMSALYGLVSSMDLIQDYNLQMSNKGVTPLWKRKLPSIMDAYAVASRTEAIVGLFGITTGYNKVFSQLSGHQGCPVFSVHTRSAGLSQVGVSQGLGHALLYLAGITTKLVGFTYNVVQVRP